VNFLANLLSGAASNAADTGSMACIGFFWDEPVCPEELL